MPQINGVLEKAQGITAENAPQAKREILEKLVDQQLFVQQAMDKGLDRSPEVVLAMEAAKRDVLARAYLQQVVAAVAAPGSDEASKFFTDHPELFTQRRLYNIEEIVLDKDSPAKPELKPMLRQGKSVQEIAAYLGGKNIRYAVNRGVRAAEQLPIELLPKYHALKDGQSDVLESEQALVVVHLIASQAQPVDQATAMPRVGQYLASEHANAAIAREAKQLRDKARIDYLGDFAQTTPAAAPAAAADAAKPAADLAKSNVDKGVAGLK